MAALRKPSLDESNRLFTGVMLGGAGVIGSTITVLFVGAMMAGLLRLHQGIIALPRRREVMAIGAVFAFHFLAISASSLYNYHDRLAFLEIVEALPFLAFLLIYGRMSLSAREDIARAAETGVIAGAFGALALALVQAQFLGLGRADGGAGNPGVFAVVCAFLYGMSIVAALRRKGAWQVAAILAVAAAAIALLLSGMRTLWPVLPLAPVLCLLVLRPRLHGRGLARALLAAAVLAVGVGLVSRNVIVERLQALEEAIRLTFTFSQYDNSLGERLRIWEAGLALAGERPWLGHGPANIPRLIMERTAATGDMLVYTHFHNFLLDAWVRAGLIGVAALLMLLLVPLLIAVRARRDAVGNAGLAMMAVLVLTYAVSGMTNIMLGHDILDSLFIYGMITATFLIFGADRGTVAPAPPKPAPADPDAAGRTAGSIAP